EVLLKVVGDNAALNATDLAPILGQPEQFIQQYQYHRMNKMSDDLTQPDVLELQLIFNENELNRSLIELGLPVWGKSRPEILLWLAVEDGGVRSIVGENDIDSELPSILKQALTKRGLSLLIPLMDLQDQTQVSFADLWAGFAEPILKASQRYGTQVVVIAKIIRKKNGEMLIIGGLIDSVESKTGDFAPILGDIPILRYLFGVEEKTMEKRELVILLTPRVI
ncbi:MAG: DUF2066 domain-containing protein, partial [Candidatus Marinimicrobia bacterium]|nr:DUF2066 domain-containing protein [Candidatus Neomarinimicrobiota bacterium]